MLNNGLGRIVPPDFDHVKKYALSDVQVPEVFVVEKTLILPIWHTQHNQGKEGACVGFGTTMMLTILNLHQCLMQGDKTAYIRYNPWWLWDRAKETDEFPDTNPGDDNGTTVRAACEVLKTQGHVVWENEADPKSFDTAEALSGISAYRWAQSIDEVRQCINENIPVAIGVNWYKNFDTPEYIDGEYWIGKGDLGIIRGGHCVCIYGASDQRQAVRIKNSWGPEYPEVWMPYSTLDRLLKEDGEVVVISDI